MGRPAVVVNNALFSDKQMGSLRYSVQVYGEGHLYVGSEKGTHVHGWV